MTIRAITTEAGLSEATLFKWLSRYRASGEAGLRPGGGALRPGRQQLPAAVKATMVEAKRAEPTWGVKRISQFMKRMLHLPWVIGVTPPQSSTS